MRSEIEPMQGEIEMNIRNEYWGEELPSQPDGDQTGGNHTGGQMRGGQGWGQMWVGGQMGA